MNVGCCFSELSNRCGYVAQSPVSRGQFIFSSYVTTGCICVLFCICCAENKLLVNTTTIILYTAIMVRRSAPYSSASGTVNV